MVHDQQVCLFTVCRLIECGGGNVISLRSSSKNLESLTKTLNYIFMDKCYLEKVRPLLAEGVPCLAPDFIAEYLFEVCIAKCIF